MLSVKDCFSDASCCTSLFFSRKNIVVMSEDNNILVVGATQTDVSIRVLKKQLPQSLIYTLDLRLPKKWTRSQVDLHFVGDFNDIQTWDSLTSKLSGIRFRTIVFDFSVLKFFQTGNDGSLYRAIANLLSSNGVFFIDSATTGCIYENILYGYIWLDGQCDKGVTLECKEEKENPDERKQNMVTVQSYNAQYLKSLDCFEDVHIGSEGFYPMIQTISQGVYKPATFLMCLGKVRTLPQDESSI
jgi:hypothetical protein